MAKMLENSVLDLAVSFFCSIFVVQKERENALTFCNGNERKKPRARFTTNNGATIFKISVQRYENYSDQPKDVHNDVRSSRQLGRVHYYPMQQHRLHR
uniref:Uncharacterized protein n=1 Tax=Siphoviridae sp. ct33S22 TaxID=2826279 RepID=A0A8S5QLZ5_9CAUD|nr:MAG TPA: hypothetical protein [Siphoviridae sp. ct33S22]